MAPTIQPHSRRGITLLEVIISLGILSVGLAAVMALVPAGGDQAMKAVVEDRRGALCANVMADFINRGLLDPQRWNTTPPTSPYRILFDPIGNGTFSPSGLTAVAPIGFTSGVMADEVFRAQDDVSYKLPDNEDDPALPLFFPGTLKRLSDGNFTWLATLVPFATTSPYYRLTVVACHRRSVPPESSATAFTLTSGTGGSQYASLTPSGLTADDFKTLFPAGTVVLVTGSGSPPTTHEWRKLVAASPTISGTSVTNVELTFDRDLTAGITWTNGNLYAVEGAIGMMEKIVHLEGISPWSQ